MTPQDMIKTLTMVGWRQKQIAQRTGTSQGTISRIANGVHKDCQHALAMRIEALLSEPVPRKAA
jgi:transcriptional regulator with XRE-family HTH domain